MSNKRMSQAVTSRRRFLQGCAAGATSLGIPALMAGGSSTSSAPARKILPLETGWLFGGKFSPAALDSRFDDAAFSRVSLPHCVARLSWTKWNPDSWEGLWIYRRHFKMPADFRGLRVFLHFDGVMVGARPVINSQGLQQHLGGYLPFRYEITKWLVPGENVLAVEVDSRWSNVPPEGSPEGPKRIDYLEAGGIHRGVRLEALPPAFLDGLFAKPVNTLQPDRRVDVLCSIDAAAGAPREVQVGVELHDGGRTISFASQSVRVDVPSRKEVRLTLRNLGNIALWEVDAPRLYTVLATLSVGGKALHEYRARIGFRDARFDLDGFFLNGRRVQLFGLNRHEIYPYAGFAMPARVKRRDAEMLRRDFNCNIVRCSHYPQSPEFLDACDELGLMVWEEVPGWGYLGDAAWKELLVRDVGDMVRRDRNRPSIVIWGTRVNESANDEGLYQRTRALARSLDDSRPTSGSMTPGSRKNWEREWHEDVFAYDDYHTARDGTVGILEPVDGHPYMLAEAVGQFNYARGKDFDCKYRRAGDLWLQRQQALRHAEAHSKAAGQPRICGVIAWCAFDYESLINPYENVKCPGVADIFRIPKLGASFYLAQADPKERVIIQPGFFWDFGPMSPRGPGRHSAVFSNCDRLDFYLDGRHHATRAPDVGNYQHLKHPPFFVDLDLDGTGHPELRIDGYLGDRLALSRSFSSDPIHDRFSLEADDTGLSSAVPDATRLVFKVVDKYGADRAFASGVVSFQLTGPGEIVGDNPFDLVGSGGVGAVWVRTIPGRAGRVIVRANHSSLGKRSITINVRR